MGEKKFDIKMSVPTEPKSENSQGAELIAKAVKHAKHREQDVKPGLLISTNDHPEFVKYGDEVIHMSPRARERVADVSKLPSQLPAGIHLRK